MTRLIDLPEVLTVGQVASYLGLSRNSAYAAVLRGEIPSVRIGRRVLVARRSLEDLFAAEPRAGETAGMPRLHAPRGDGPRPGSSSPFTDRGQGDVT
jgi:excisionase family DNA binding protein